MLFYTISGSSPMSKFLPWLQKRIYHWLKPASPTLIVFGSCNKYAKQRRGREVRGI